MSVTYIQVVGPVPSPVEMQPWLAMWHQQRLPVQRLLLRALEHVTDLAGTSVHTCNCTEAIIVA